VSAGWAQAIGTVFLALVGLWLAHNYRRQVGLKLAERRIDAYMGLWALMADASPGRTEPLDQDERQRLRDDMNRWYFAEGNGIFMSTPARDLWVAVQANLTCPVESMRPPSLVGLADEDAERRRGCVCISQVSLLRHQMKADVNLHADLYYHTGLRVEDRDFLLACGLSPRRRPWRRARMRMRTTPPTMCVCGGCPTA
jgi:hypothetical protein